jgi:FkbM family methyltransferase
VARSLAPLAARVSTLAGYGVLGQPRGHAERVSEIIATREGLGWCFDLRDDAQRIMFIGRYERELRKAALAEVRRGDVFVDVGANVGFWSLPAALRGASVIAFEPNPYAVTRLRRNVELNPGLRIDVRSTAVGAETGELELYAFDLEAGSSTATFNRSAVATIGKEFGAVAPDAIEQVTVPVTTLDGAELDRIDVLKVDVEGHEEAVLEGAHETLSELAPRLVVIELLGTRFGHAGNSPERVATILNEHGYRADLPRPLPDDFHDTVVFRRDD